MKCCPFKKVIVSTPHSLDTTVIESFSECDEEQCMLCYKQTTIGYYGGCNNGD